MRSGVNHATTQLHTGETKNALKLNPISYMHTFNSMVHNIQSLGLKCNNNWATAQQWTMGNKGMSERCCKNMLALLCLDL